MAQAHQCPSTQCGYHNEPQAKHCARCGCKLGNGKPASTSALRDAVSIVAGGFVLLLLVALGLYLGSL